MKRTGPLAIEEKPLKRDAEADPRGLAPADVAARERAGQVNRLALRSSRTVGQILRANLVTRFNAILGVLLLVIVVVGPFQDALFGIVLAANTAIGVVQEVRAKRSLDRLALLAAPRAIVRRGDDEVALPVGRVVLDDVLALRPGDQVVVDGTVLAAEGLEVDESLLTGEADPWSRKPAATIVLFAVAFWVLGAVARPLDAARTALLALMAASFLGVLTIGGLRHFYGLVPPPLLGWVSAVIIAISAMLALETWWRWQHRKRR